MAVPSFADLFSGQNLLGTGLGGQQTTPDAQGNATPQIGGGGLGANTLVGLGMGLLQPWAQGSSPWANALPAYQAGAQADALNQYRRAQLAQQQADMKLRRDIAFRDPEQLRLWNATANNPEMRQAFFPKLDSLELAANQRQAVAQKQGLDLTNPDVKTWIVTGQATQLAPTLTPHQQATIEKADDTVASTQNVISALTYAKKISPLAPSGALGGLSETVGTAFPSVMSEEVKNRLLLKNAVTGQALEQLRATFGGNPTEGERKVMLQMQGSVDQPDAVRQEIFDRAIGLAQKRLELNQRRAQEVRGQTYYKPGGGPQSGESKAPAFSGGTPRITNSSQYNQLPSGQQYYDPDGNLRTKQ